MHGPDPPPRAATPQSPRPRPTRPPGAAGSIWLLSGTGEGPPLAAALLERGWGVEVSVVTPEASRAYAAHPRLRLRVGALAGPGAIEARLDAPGPCGDGWRWVVDASHPFASRISADLALVCRRRCQPLLRLRRPALGAAGGSRLTLLPDLEALAGQDLSRERLLLAIGARQLGRALALAAAGASFARILPAPASLRQARAAGLADGQLACHRPGHGQRSDGLQGDPFALERALLRRWRITAVLCRQSGGTTETCWQTLCGEAGLRLLLLERPAEPDRVRALPAAALLEMVGRPHPPG